MTTTTNFLYEANQASKTVQDAVNKHCQKFNIPCSYGFGGLAVDSKKSYGYVPYIVVDGDKIKIDDFGWHRDKFLALLLSNQSPLYKINCQ